MSVNPIPDGSHTLTVSLTIAGAASAIDFYQRAFGALELYRMAMPDGKLMHGELRIGDSTLLLSDEMPEWGALGPATMGGCPCVFRLYFPDADAVFQRAIDAGAAVVRPMQDQFWGDRSGMLKDPFGYRWSIAQHVEDVSPEEITRRAQGFMSGAK